MPTNAQRQRSSAKSTKQKAEYVTFNAGPELPPRTIEQARPNRKAQVTAGVITFMRRRSHANPARAVAKSTPAAGNGTTAFAHSKAIWPVVNFTLVNLCSPVKLAITFANPVQGLLEGAVLFGFTMSPVMVGGFRLQAQQRGHEANRI
jgi:hypothetical protein